MTMGASRSAAPSAGKKPRKVRGMQTLQNFFSPSPSTSKEKASKEEKKNAAASAAVVGRGKRDRNKPAPGNDGSTKAPLQLLNDNNDSDRNAKRAKTKHNATTTNHQEQGEGTMGLFRIAGMEDDKTSLSLTASRKHAHTHILHPGATIGRNVPSDSRRSSSGSKKLDLNIPHTASGVSRKQIRIVNVHPGSVTIKQEKILNPIGIYRYDPKKKTMNPKIHFLESEETVTLQNGDVIEFDNYNRAAGRLAKPQHVFRVVTVMNDAITEDSECEIVTEKKQAASGEEAMEIDSAQPAASGQKVSEEVFVDSFSTPAAEDESFHTAHANQSSNATRSVPSTSGQTTPAGVAVSSNVATPNTEVIQATTGLKRPQETKDGTAEPSSASCKRPGTADSGNADSISTVKFPRKEATPKIQVAEKKVKASMSTNASKEKESDTAMEIEPANAKKAASPSDAKETGSKKTPVDDDIEMTNSKESAAPEAEISPVVRTPKVGDRFRAVYDREKEISDNFLGFARPAW